MVVVGVEKIETFLRKHTECRQELSELVREFETSQFVDPMAVKSRYPSSKIIDGRIAVFKIRGNRYRLTARMAYNTQVLVILAVETHSDYDARRLR